MIGPGWMPSRPRPLGRRKLLVCSVGYARRRRTRRTRSATAQAASSAGWPLDHEAGGIPSPLPTATLRTTAVAWHRVAAGDLQRWMTERWLWLRPRSVPIIVAFAAMLAMVDAVKHLAIYARGDDVVRIDAPRPLPYRHIGSAETTARERVRPLYVPSTPSHPVVLYSE